MRSALDNAGTQYVYINIRQDEAARAIVRELNDGCESVPTLVFPDGSKLTEPSLAVLHEKLGIGSGAPAPEYSPGTHLRRRVELSLLVLGAAVLGFGLLARSEALAILGGVFLLGWLGLSFVRRGITGG